MIAKHIDFSILTSVAAIRGLLISFHKKETGAHGGTHALGHTSKISLGSILTFGYLTSNPMWFLLP